jgi:hypothetical protein
MADIRATKNGNWSDATVWTPNPPAAGDVVRPNNFTVTIDISVAVTEIRNDAGGGAVLGGRFVINDGVTVSASNGFYGTYQNTAGHALLDYSGSDSIIVNGDLYGSQVNVTLGSCLLISSTGTVTVNGDLTTINVGPNASGIRITSTGTFILNGNINHNNTGFGIRNNEGVGTVTVNGNITLSLGGTAIPNTSGTVTITGNITANAGTAITNTSGTVTIGGNITVNGGTSISNTSGTITITGDLTITTDQVANGISSSGGIINFVGNATAGTPGNGITNHNCFNISGGILNITGNLFAKGTSGSSNLTVSRVVFLSSTGTVNITGTVNGPDYLRTGILTSQQNLQNAFGVVNEAASDVNIIGNCIGDTSFLSLGNTSAILRQIYNAVSNRSTGTINITGNVLGGSFGVSVSNISTGTININGDVIGGQAVAGAVNTSTGTIDITGAAEGGVSFAGVENDLSNGTILVQKIRFGTNGQVATRGYIKFKNTVNIAAETVLKTDATTTNLVDINVVPNLQPAISDVRLGVTYSSGSLTGTMNVPPFNAVKAGVPVDNGVGTAALSPEDVWNVLISGLTQSGSIGERLKIVSTIETTGTQLASFNV